MIAREFILNFMWTFALLISASLLQLVIEGSISGVVWLFVFKAIPFFILSFLNSLIFLILGFLVEKKKLILDFLPTLMWSLFILFKIQTSTKNYGTAMFLLGILVALFISNYLRKKRIEKM